MRLLTAWAGGTPVSYRVCTVLNGVTLSEPVETQEGIRLVPLPLTTNRLHRMPFTMGATPQDCLGLTLLTLQLSASPALFRPDSNAQEQAVRSLGADDTDFDLVCEGLSLQGNCHVSWSVLWNDYLDATPLCLGIRDSWGGSSSGLQQLPHKGRQDSPSGEVTIQPADYVNPQRLDGEKLSHTLKGLRAADKKLRIAVRRWRRSKDAENLMSLVDQFIDLRIALELLFLRGSRNGRDQEMSFRMSLFGAWYLAESPGERRSIRKSLRDAYGAASEAVHQGELGRGKGKVLSVAQDLCRQGILKLLREGRLAIGTTWFWVPTVASSSVSRLGKRSRILHTWKNRMKPRWKGIRPCAWTGSTRRLCRVSITAANQHARRFLVDDIDWRPCFARRLATITPSTKPWLGNKLSRH